MLLVSPGHVCTIQVCMLCVSNSARKYQQKELNFEKKNLDSYCQVCDNADTGMCLLMQCCDMHVIVAHPSCPVVRRQEAW